MCPSWTDSLQHALFRISSISSVKYSTALLPTSWAGMCAFMYSIVCHSTQSIYIPSFLLCSCKNKYIYFGQHLGMRNTIQYITNYTIATMRWIETIAMSVWRRRLMLTWKASASIPHLLMSSRYIHTYIHIYHRVLLQTLINYLLVLLIWVDFGYMSVNQSTSLRKDLFRSMILIIIV